MWLWNEAAGWNSSQKRIVSKLALEKYWIDPPLPKSNYISLLPVTQSQYSGINF